MQLTDDTLTLYFGMSYLKTDIQKKKKKPNKKKTRLYEERSNSSVTEGIYLLY